jgi:DNA-binding transcriptional LysR family regulator
VPCNPPAGLNEGITVNERALRYFLAVFRAGSIRGAAEALHVSASAVSRQVAELELDCKETLLERLPRGVAVTEAGRLVAEFAQRQADETERLEDRLRRLRGAEQGIVRISCGAGFLPDLVDNALAAYAAAHPGIVFQVAPNTTDGILAAIAGNEADIGLAYNPASHPDVRTVALSRQPIAAIVPPHHPLVARPRALALRMFAGEPTILLPADHGVRKLLGRVEADGGFRLTPRLETSSFEMHRLCVAAGLGIAFLPMFAVAADLRRGRVAAAMLTDPLLAAASAHLMVRAGRRLPDTIGNLLDWIARHAQAFRA